MDSESLEEPFHGDTIGAWTCDDREYRPLFGISIFVNFIFYDFKCFLEIKRSFIYFL